MIVQLQSPMCPTPGELPGSVGRKASVVVGSGNGVIDVGDPLGTEF